MINKGKIVKNTKYINSNINYCNQTINYVQKQIEQMQFIEEQYVMEKMYNICKWFDIKLETNCKKGMMYTNGKTMKFIPLYKIKYWFGLKRGSNIEPKLNNMIMNFYKFETKIKQGN